ncbi:MAG: tetratricopeptide repeat protein [Fibrobacteria bacterium]|nr:tetratricopeptide repeat protein [Fibrobacteria bacterium]
MKNRILFFCFFICFISFSHAKSQDELKPLSLEELNKYNLISSSSLYREAVRVYREGLIKYTTGDFTGAKRDFEKVLKLDPLHADCYQLIFKASIHGTALKLKTEPKAFSLFEKGITHYLSGNLEETLVNWEQSLNVVPDNKKLLSLIDLLKDKISKNSTEKDNIKRSEELFLSAVELELEGKNQEAIARLDKAVQLNPGHENALMLKQKLNNRISTSKNAYLTAGRTQILNGKLSLALTSFKNGLKLEPQNNELKSAAEYVANQIDSAIAGAIKNYKSQIKLGNMIMANKIIYDYQQLYPKHKDIISLQKEHKGNIKTVVSRYIKKADKLMADNEYDRAEKLYTTALRYDPDYALAGRRLQEIKTKRELSQQNDLIARQDAEADKFLAGGFPEKALSIWNEILKNQPEHKDVTRKVERVSKMLKSQETNQKYDKLFQNGLAQYRKGKINDAKKMWMALLIEKPDYDKAKSFLKKIEQRINQETKTAKSFTSKGNWNAAIRAWKTVLQLDPSNNLAKQKYADVNLLLQKEQDKKAKSLRKTPIQKPTLPPAKIEELFQKGLVHYKQGKYSEALKEWQNILSADPSNKRAAGYIKNLKAKMERLKKL